MKREIRFRGKDIKTGEWIEGFYAMHHVPETDNHDKVTGFKEIPCIFNDELDTTPLIPLNTGNGPLSKAELPR